MYLHGERVLRAFNKVRFASGGRFPYDCNEKLASLNPNSRAGRFWSANQELEEREKERVEKFFKYSEHAKLSFDSTGR